MHPGEAIALKKGVYLAQFVDYIFGWSITRLLAKQLVDCFSKCFFVFGFSTFSIALEKQE